jgi:hypothetical protein
MPIAIMMALEALISGRKKPEQAQNRSTAVTSSPTRVIDNHLSRDATSVIGPGNFAVASLGSGDKFIQTPRIALL